MIIDKVLENKSYVNHKVVTRQFSNLQVTNCHIDSTTTESDYLKLMVENTKVWKLNSLGGEVSKAQILRSVFLESSFPDVMDSTFEGCDFQNNTWGNQVTNCTFEYCTFEYESFDSSRFQDCTFKNCTFYNCTFDLSFFSNCLFLNCKMQGNDWGSGKLVMCSFKDCTLSNEDWRQAIFLSGDISNSWILKCFIDHQLNEVSMYQVEIHSLQGETYVEAQQELDLLSPLALLYFSNSQNHNADFLRILSLIREILGYEFNSGALVYKLPECLFNKLWNPSEFHTELYKYHPKK